MDTLKILLGVTIALLLGALGMTWQNQKNQVQNTDKDELAELNRKIDEISRHNEIIQRETQRLSLAAQNQAQIEQENKTAELERMREELRRAEEERKAAEALAQTDSDLTNREGAFKDGMDARSRNKEARRAEMIRNALVIARVQEWVSDAQLGDFGTIQVVMPENVQQNTVLLVRRNNGILGKLKVSEVNLEGAIVNPITAFDAVKPQTGDELILEPPFFND